MVTVKLSKIIAPTFASVHRDIKQHRHTHYWLKGGRGSTKSSFISVEIPLGMMRDAGKGQYTNAIVLRRYGVTLRESVFEQIGWAINALGVAELWKSSVSPMSWTYLPTGQRIIFRGADDPTKVKSIKFAVGWAKYLWYEEVNEFEGAEKIRSINQSVLRGGADFFAFYSFTPPKAARNWVNQYVAIEREDTLVHHSTYLTVPPEWLGEQFIVEAEHLKAVKPEAYRHEYLGEVTGTGGGVNPRTVIGQREDGAVLLLVIDGRQTTSLGASYSDCIDIMTQYGAMNAANLDGGSSSVMVYDGQIINNVVSMNGDRKVPTAFIVK